MPISLKNTVQGSVAITDHLYPVQIFKQENLATSCESYDAGTRLLDNYEQR